jgi:hypothetical protein
MDAGNEAAQGLLIRSHKFPRCGGAEAQHLLLIWHWKIGERRRRTFFRGEVLRVLLRA